MAFEQVGVQFIAAGGDVYISTMGDATKVTNGFVDATEQGGGKVSGAGQVMIGALRQVGTIAVDALAKAGQAVAGFLSDSVSVAGNFQAGMQEFQSVAGKDVDTAGLEKFHDLFIQIGKELPVSTGDVQQAAIEMVKGGIDPATVAAGGLRQNIQFAAAAMKGDLVGAAEISSKILGGWSDANATAAEKSDFLTRSTDLLTKAANASSVDVKELSLGIFNAQGIAKTAGVSFDDLTTTLAEISPRFASSSEAGNSLKNVIARLQPTTKPATEAMAALGLITEDGANKFYDAQGQFIGFQAASQMLQDSLVGLTNQQKQATLQQIFGNDAMNAASALAELGSAGYQKMADSLENANGVQAAAALTQQGYNTSLENAKGSLEALQITIGEKLLPVITMLLNDYIAPGVNAVTSFADAFFKAHDATGSWTAAIDQFLPGFQSFYDTAVQVAGFIADNLTPILAAVSAMILSAVIPAFAAWLPVAVTTATATIAALAPVIVPIVAIGAAVALLAKAWDSDWLGIRTAVTDFWNKYGEPIFTEVQTWLSKNIPIAVQAAATFFTDTFLPAIKGIWEFINAYVIPLFVALFRVEFEVAKLAVTALAGIWQNVLWPALQKVWSFIQGSVIPIFQDIGSYLSDTFGPVLTDLTGWLGGVTGGFDGITSAISSAITWVNDLADSISHLSLPDWATPGSPTPAEIGFRGMAKALKTELNPQIGALFHTLTMAPASPAQLASGGSTTTYNQQRNYNMPIHTNQSPAVLQQSLAIVQATMA